ncbi:hypothetical protein CMO93_02290 [Candidatus Woesearchaeota archaeon]|nr:hypothetical protein [Candidatus Woesearchaeota archaeon]|tara:strand:- start:612 stop:875 length:264 start_codon:yes stop_codon:yes gene_type:complete
MNYKILNVLIYVILIFILVLLFILINIEENKAPIKQTEINGSMQIFNVSNEKENTNYQPTKTSERYDDKYLEYLDNIQESRDKTFQR